MTPSYSAMPLEHSLAPVGVRTRSLIILALEIAALALWAFVVTRPWLNMDPSITPRGGEYALAIQSNHLWTRVVECGWCAMWNGSVRGGLPAFGEFHNSMLHPLVAVTTLGWGVLNGSKVALFVIFWAAGLSQLWLGYLLRIGSAARVWAAAIAIASGHLAGRMDQGNFGLALSTVACSLAIPAILYFMTRGTIKAAVLLGVILASAIMSGQGYMQLALLAIAPAALILLLNNPNPIGQLVGRGAIAVGLALLLSAPFLLPALSFLPQQAKDVDVTLSNGQPLAFMPLNLVINDFKYYQGEALGRKGLPYIYDLYIGWIPILFALWAVVKERRPDVARSVAYLVGVAVLAFLVGSAGLLAMLARLSEPLPTLRDFFFGFRFYPLMAGLAVPSMLGLSGVGLHYAWNGRWPVIDIGWSSDAAHREAFHVSTRLVLLAPMLFALWGVYSFTTQWIHNTPVHPMTAEMIAALRTPDLQWVRQPYGELFWQEAAIGAGLKLSEGTLGWGLKNRPSPEPVRVAERGTAPPGATRIGMVDGAGIYALPPGREYAAVTHPDGSRTVCTATGVGGDVDVRCELPSAGVLTVKENAWAGWSARIDGERTSLASSQWLAVNAPAGSHSVEFRYRPWDVPLGLALMVVGLGLVGYLVWRGDRPAASPPGGAVTVTPEVDGS